MCFSRKERISPLFTRQLIRYDLFHGSAGDGLSTSDSIVTDKGNIKTGYNNKRKAENGDGKTEGGKKQRGHNKE